MAAGKPDSSTSTAQSAMFKNTTSGQFLIEGSEVWEYNKTTAATYFSNTLVGGPTIDCNGNAANCAPANQPAAPAAPEPDPKALTSHISNQACNFWNGVALDIDGGKKSPYYQSVTTKGLNGGGNWKFEWTYEVGFVDEVGGPYDAHTAWDLDSSTPAGVANVTVEGFFAGQSTQKKGKAGADKWTFKASHTMSEIDPSNGLPVSRLVNPVAALYGAGVDPICTLAIFTQLEQGVDYEYIGNAGTNGDVSQLFPIGLVSDIQQGVLSTGSGLWDNFAGNDYTNGERAVITGTDPANCEISEPGTYELIVTGVLKGVSGAFSLPFGVTSNVCISAGTCQVCPQ